MKYYIIELNYSSKVGYVVFVTDNKKVMSEYQTIVSAIDNSVNEDTASKYTRRVMWIVFGPRADEIYRIVVPDGDFSTVHDAVIQFFTEKIEKSKGEGI
jgi:hypothetical protein